MTAMPHLAQVDWDHADRMQSADLGGGGTVWFLYDAAGNRVRKIRVNQAGSSTYERVYLGGYEVYRERVGTEVQLERQTLHVADDTGRICLVETKTVDDADVVPLPANTSRYQYGNHLGSVGMELDETGQLISYEEFHPYGTTAYRAANSAVDVSPSRYRYTGKERDEETGLGHHGARYYASWLGRWTAVDPIGLGDGINRFAYTNGRPTTLRDPSGQFGSPVDNTATIREELTGLVNDYVKAEPGSDRERQLREAIEILRAEIGEPTRELGPQPAPEGSFVERAVSDPGRVHDFEQWGRDVRARADDRAGTAAKGTAVLFAIGGGLGAGAAGLAAASEAGLFGRAVVVGMEEAELFGIAMEANPVFAAGVVTVGAAAEAESVATGMPPGTGGGGRRLPKVRVSATPKVEAAAMGGARISSKDAVRIDEIRSQLDIGKKRNIAYGEGHVDGKDFGEVLGISGQQTPGVPAPSERIFKTEVVGHDRAFDSEALILENFARRLNPSSKGTLHLVSERAVCESCAGVISRFREMFPNINLIVRAGRGG